MSEKHLVTCPRCGFRITDQGEPDNPGLTDDIQTFSRTCPLTADQPGSMAEQSFNCPELLKAVRSAALSGEAGRTADMQSHNVEGPRPGNGKDPKRRSKTLWPLVVIVGLLAAITVNLLGRP